MKKLLGILLSVLMLAACSQEHNARAPHGGQGPNHQAIEAAMKACHDSTKKEDKAAFDRCMKEKGFEKPAGSPPNGQQPPKAH